MGSRLGSALCFPSLHSAAQEVLCHTFCAWGSAIQSLVSLFPHCLCCLLATPGLLPLTCFRCYKTRQGESLTSPGGDDPSPGRRGTALSQAVRP